MGRKGGYNFRDQRITTITHPISESNFTSAGPKLSIRNDTFWYRDLIPRFLAEFTSKENLNLSKMLEGQVPEGGVFRNLSAVSVTGNNKLCGGPPTLKLLKCEAVRKNNRRSVSRGTVLAISISISTILLLAGIISMVLYRSKKSKRKTTIHSLPENHHPQLSYAELSQVTDGSSPANIIGEGRFGAVYKGVLPGTLQVVAIKAHMGDFGLAKFFVDRSSGTTLSSMIGIRGSIGYVAPENGVGGEVSTQGDVYSFGILTLEQFTGKRPTGPMFGGNFGLREFVETSLTHELLQVVDPMLHIGGQDLEPHSSLLECLASILRVGLACSLGFIAK
ncbi:hypothetical protein CRG98_017480 [Punica granatum]|uniref:Protein kinase domain-containing protein n=1 Tax=Punica granatum TaxID=22663 RepID=A0A2I0K0L9_PUNGR|nr:hypothetical protein CRG98_017480 [Punica granatum]